jgi:DNA-binding MarR family transcriptional regulator
MGPEEFTYTALAAAEEQHLDLDLDAMSVMSHLLRIHSMIARDLEVNVHRPAGATFAAFRMMFLLRTNGSMAPQDIADLLHVAPSSVSAVVKTLERYQLVSRSRKSRDGRVVTVALTDRGIEVVDELVRRNNRREIEWVQPLSRSEQETLVRLLNKMLVQHPGPPDGVGGRLIPDARADRLATPERA